MYNRRNIVECYKLNGTILSTKSNVASTKPNVASTMLLSLSRLFRKDENFKKKRVRRCCQRQQYRSNDRLCRRNRSTCSIRQCCVDIVASTVLLRHCCWCGRGFKQRRRSEVGWDASATNRLFIRARRDIASQARTEVGAAARRNCLIATRRACGATIRRGTPCTHPGWRGLLPLPTVSELELVAARAGTAAKFSNERRTVADWCTRARSLADARIRTWLTDERPDLHAPRLYLWNANSRITRCENLHSSYTNGRQTYSNNCYKAMLRK